MNKKYYRIALLLYFIAISVLSLNKFNSNKSLNNITVVSIRGDYFFHFLAYIPMFILGKLSFDIKGWILLIISLLISSSLEIIQYYVPYRAFNINDLLANCIGVLIGFVCCITVTKIISK